MGNITKKRCKTRNGIPEGYPAPLVLLLILSLPRSSALSITWLPNLEWNTVKNWADGLIPQNGTRVVFPVEMRLSVGLPAQSSPLDLAGLELPRDGALALPQTGSLTISQAKDSARTAHWSLEGPLLWVDPNNWSSERSSTAVPHLERIPCQDDVVVLPESKRTISIQLPSTRETKVKAVRVTGDTGDLPSWEWRTQIQMQREFSSGPMSVGYTGVQNCIECTCQLESIGREILKEVCNTRGASCPALECEYPLTIEGHCCYYCGGRVVLTDKTSISLAKRMANLGLKNYASTLSWYARRTWDSKTEILIAGKQKYSEKDTALAIASLTPVLEEQGITVISIDTTGGEVWMSKSATIAEIFFGTLLIAIILFLAVLPTFGYPLPQVLGESWRGFRELVRPSETEILATGRNATLPRKPFRFAKFENAPEAEVELTASPSNIVPIHEAVQDEDEDGEEGGGRFANPLYRSGRRQPEVQSFAALQRLEKDIADEEVELAVEP